MDLDHELLQAGEEAALLRRAQAGDRAAREELVQKNQRLIFKYASRYFWCGVGGDQELEDLMQWGNIGLLRAIDRWDGRRGLRFSTYAVSWIKESIYRQGMLAGNPYKLSYRDSTRLASIRKIRADLMQRGVHEPGASEIAAAAGLDENFVAGALLIIDGLTRLDGELDNAGAGDNGDYEQQVILDLLPDPTLGPAELAERQVVLGALRAAARQLPEREQEVLRRRFFADPPDSYQVIGRDLGCSAENARLIEAQAITQLRALINP